MAFINRIPKEQKENAVKWRSLLDISSDLHDEDFEQHINQDFFEDVSEKLEKFEESFEKKYSPKEKVVKEKELKENILGI